MTLVTHHERNVVALQKDNESYLFFYDDSEEERHIIRETLGDFAADPDLSFTWSDCVQLCRGMQRIQQENDLGKRLFRKSRFS